MVHEKNHKVTDEMRDSIWELYTVGLSATRIGQLLGVSSSTASYTVQIYKAVGNEDWETCRRLLKSAGPTVKWALDRLNKTMPEIEETPVAPVVYTESTTAAKLDEILKAVNGVGYLLGQILEKLS